ncbi:CoA transferase subunit A [Paraburkholderia xenovorans]|uniref:Coenzyme A transferase, subunit A n=1 Tax=Paraburkholderia xenovorans (strain LB400) TaxID=266265 RepID=Q13G81_PARXL|nr:CoA-transferase [Paraburkholderia xenovorans]ABE36908.1 Putative coenzyme A transferase, subunit A [Paraburkholderia xenovorans LB400]
MRTTAREEPRDHPARRSKLTSLADALERVEAGQLLALGGLWFHNNPCAAVRALARRKVRNLRLVAAPPSSYAVDLLIGAGCVAQATVGHVSFEHLGFAPNFRRAAQEGSVSIVDADEATILGGLMATLEHLDSHPVTSVKGTDIGRSAAAPRNGAGVVAPLALRPDVCLLHAQEADIYGNVRNLGTPFCDPLFAKASKYVIVTVDRIIDNGEIRAQPNRTTIPGYLVDAVVEAPFGAHPCSSHGIHVHDEPGISAYIEAGANADTWRREYFGPYVEEPESLEDYVRSVGGADRILALSEVVR